MTQLDKNSKIAVLGLGIEGKDVIQYLLGKGVEDITLYDKKTASELDFPAFDSKKNKLICGPDYLSGGLTGYDFVFRSPGVYRFLPEIVKAQKDGSVITSGIKYFFENCPGKIIGVTGTKGKGTTTTLIYEILKSQGYDAYLAGNIGYPPLQTLPRLTKRSWIVMELSSFQLIDLDKSPDISVVLNITLDHMDWHKSESEYVNAKKNIITHQTGTGISVINADYQKSKSFEKLANGKVFEFSRLKKVKGAYLENSKLYIDCQEKLFICGKNELLLRGQHNIENVLAASLASYLSGVDILKIRNIVKSFKGLEHRLELVGFINKTGFYNDSFSTNPQTTSAAVKAFKEPITVILGGFSKNLNYDEMAKDMVNSSVTCVVLIGDISDVIKKSLIKAKYSKKILELGKSKMLDIVKTAYENTPSGGVVILSPGTSSFDMFENYKVRGIEFKKAFLSLRKTFNLKK